jgi:hypothetical protein
MRAHSRSSALAAQPHSPAHDSSACLHLFRRPESDKFDRDHVLRSQQSSRKNKELLAVGQQDLSVAKEEKQNFCVR